MTRRKFVETIGRQYGELRRRKVVRVALVYLVAAWVAIEVASVVLPELMLPDWSVRLLIVLAAAGFPFALVLAWVFDITPEGVQRTLPAAAPTAATSMAGTIEPAAITGPAAPPERSLAVLPFRNIGGDRDNEYFCEGLAEDLLIVLGRVPGLRVAARSSSFAFRDGTDDVRTIGERLNVASVLEGSVRKDDRQLRIAVRLVDTADGYQRWAEVFDRELGAIFDIQREISRAVVDALDVEIYGGQRPRVAPGTDDIEAYNLYLMGRHQFHKRTEAALSKAVEFFRQATERDPRFALPYTGLADAYALLSDSGEAYGRMPVAEAIALAAPMMERALELEPLLAEAHASRGFLARMRLDIAAAERALRRSLELDPGYPLAHVWLALTLSDLGRLREARDEFERAYAADPLSPIIGTNLGFSHLQFSDFDAAQACFARVLEIAPDFPVAYAGMANVEQGRGHPAEAQTWWQRASRVAPERASYPANLALLQLEQGEPAAAEPFLARAEELSPRYPHVVRARMAALIATRRDAELVEFTEQRIAGADPGAESWSNAGLAQLVAGRPGEAVRRYERAGPDLQRWLSDSLVWGWRFAHGLHYADALLRTGERDHARELLQQAEQLFARLEAEGMVKPDIDYERAVVLALRAEYDAAAAALERAVQRGWKLRWWARRDPGLDGLRALGRVDWLQAG
ncbi:MAG TPA: tetratricopeptide repeat protein [Gammaproteobacteria bacterium]|nr:tetratricopeptide repeat protein [Gammaproteobacteria bacterium]